MIAPLGWDGILVPFQDVFWILPFVFEQFLQKATVNVAGNGRESMRSLLAFAELLTANKVSLAIKVSLFT